jgi:hypothetical protein
LRWPAGCPPVTTTLVDGPVDCVVDGRATGGFLAGFGE